MIDEMNVLIQQLRRACNPCLSFTGTVIRRQEDLYDYGDVIQDGNLSVTLTDKLLEFEGSCVEVVCFLPNNGVNADPEGRA